MRVHRKSAEGGGGRGERGRENVLRAEKVSARVKERERREGMTTERQTRQAGV